MAFLDNESVSLVTSTWTCKLRVGECTCSYVRSDSDECTMATSLNWHPISFPVTGDPKVSPHFISIDARDRLDQTRY
jgi:hypothetical protein